MPGCRDPEWARSRGDPGPSDDEARTNAPARCTTCRAFVAAAGRARPASRSDSWISDGSGRSRTARGMRRWAVLLSLLGVACSLVSVWIESATDAEAPGEHRLDGARAASRQSETAAPARNADDRERGREPESSKSPRIAPVAPPQLAPVSSDRELPEHPRKRSAASANSKTQPTSACTVNRRSPRMARR
jgi:hypothetical protein